MINYIVSREFGNYSVINSHNSIIFSAKNISHFFGPEQFIYIDSSGKVFARFQCRVFFGFGFNHQILFNDGCSVRIKFKLRGLYFKYHKSSYQILFKRSEDDILLKDGAVVGVVKVVKSDVSCFEHSISSEDETTCFIFSMIDIAMNNFDVS